MLVDAFCKQFAFNISFPFVEFKSCLESFFGLPGRKGNYKIIFVFVFFG